MTGRKGAFEFRTVASSNSKGLQHDRLVADYVSSFSVAATPLSAVSKARGIHGASALLPQTMLRAQVDLSNPQAVKTPTTT